MTKSTTFPAQSPDILNKNSSFEHHDHDLSKSGHHSREITQFSMNQQMHNEQFRDSVDEGIMEKIDKRHIRKQKSKSMNLTVDMSTGHLNMDIIDTDDEREHHEPSHSVNHSRLSHIVFESPNIHPMIMMH